MSGGECHWTIIGALNSGGTVHQIAFRLRTTSSAFRRKSTNKASHFAPKTTRKALNQRSFVLSELFVRVSNVDHFQFLDGMIGPICNRVSLEN
jgi:hypothetical protein